MYARTVVEAVGRDLPANPDLVGYTGRDQPFRWANSATISIYSRHVPVRERARLQRARDFIAQHEESLAFYRRQVEDTRYELGRLDERLGGQQP